MSLSSQELKEAMFQTRLEIFDLMYKLQITKEPQEKKVINGRIKTLQRLHYWQFRQLKNLDEQE